MKQTVNIPQGESRLIGGQWYNQGDHEIDVPDPLEGLKQPDEVANLDMPRAEDSPEPKPKKSKSSAEPTAEVPQEISSESKE